MKALSRMELEEKGAGSPEGLVTRILKLVSDMPIPTPIEELCKQLDIADIRPLETEGFEGGLITDTDRSEGVILVNKNSHYYRQRFTIGHELAHFLIPTHMPDKAGHFLCSRDDMNLLTAKENDRRARMEVEANRFSALILIPPPALRKALSKTAPDLARVVKLAEDFNVSKQAMSRAYADYHEELVAIVGVKDGKIISISKNRMRFPFIQPRISAPVPASSVFHRLDHESNAVSEFAECLADHWIETTRGEAAPLIYEQVYRQRDGYALILLHLEQAGEEEEEERDLERGWEARFRR